ncbi:hypothetical protein CEQ30_04640 [Nocardia brasiliensis]|uniref:hypothetical protein n=1 Tax=Nocardia brasiliensis TaxID=37326 RepID=UPI0002E73CE1|nr:hypothetical protein [Nocardia brasiliensis]ASF06736.1 hypothetical protein CEQ30_04640 [Nocardia brasiliensis]
MPSAGAAAFLPAETGLRRSALIELIEVDLQHRGRATGDGKRADGHRPRPTRKPGELSCAAR